jgi:predicted nucleic acid-binding protein
MAVRPILLDTDVASLLIKGRLPITLGTKLIGSELILPFVAWAELVTWANVRNWGVANRSILHRWMSDRVFLPGDKSVADVCGVIAAEAQQRGRPRQRNDTWIAACGLAHDLPVATMNVKDFDDFRIHHGLSIVTA